MQCNKTLAFYIRLSAEDADLKSSGKAESNSVTNQRKLLRDYYEQHTELCEYEVVEFCDDGYTGTNFDRPQFMLMIGADTPERNTSDHGQGSFTIWTRLPGGWRISGADITIVRDSFYLCKR